MFPMKKIFSMQLNFTRVTIGLRETWKILTSESFWWLSLHLYYILSYARYLIIVIMTVESVCFFFLSILTSALLTALALEIIFFISHPPTPLTPSNLRDHDHNWGGVSLVINIDPVTFGCIEWKTIRKRGEHNRQLEINVNIWFIWHLH